MKNMKGLDAHVKRVTVALTVAALVQAGSALAALELRDINGNATAIAVDAEFAYDTALGATWYLTANNTGLNWNEAKNWAAGLTVGIFSGWSLPATDPGCGGAPQCTGSQVEQLYYWTLGNAFGGLLSNTGPFKNLLSYTYWLSTAAMDDFGDPSYAWAFSTRDGLSGILRKDFLLYALAIRPGDVAAVPEPGTVALLLSGLAGVMAMRRRQIKA